MHGHCVGRVGVSAPVAVPPGAAARSVFQVLAGLKELLTEGLMTLGPKLLCTGGRGSESGHSWPWAPPGFRCLGRLRLIFDLKSSASIP